MVSDMNWTYGFRDKINEVREERRRNQDYETSGRTHWSFWGGTTRCYENHDKPRERSRTNYNPWEMT